MSSRSLNSQDALNHHAPPPDLPAQDWQRASRMHGAAGRVAKAGHGGAAGQCVPGDNAQEQANAPSAASTSGWWRSATRLVREAAIGLAFVVALPLVVIAVRGPSAFLGARSMDQRLSHVTSRLTDVDRLRPLMSPRNAAVSAAEAGAAFHAMQAPRSHGAKLLSAAFPEHPVATPFARPWLDRSQAIGMFPAAGNVGQDAVVATDVVTRATGGFSTQEMVYLRSVAEAPIWHEFDRVTSAPRVDLVGGQFVLPFRDDAFAPAMPVHRFVDTKALAYAGVSRAAYYVALGEPARAEAALRSIVSLGFMFIDNGTNSIDALIGRVVLDIGRNGLHQLYEATGNASGLTLSAPLPTRTAAGVTPARSVASANEIRARVIAETSDPQLPRALRFERLNQLAFSSCGSVREVLFGMRSDVSGAIDRADASLARYPSEHALVKLMREGPARVHALYGTRSGADMLISGAASVAATVLQQPRIAACTQLALAID